MLKAGKLFTAFAIAGALGAGAAQAQVPYIDGGAGNDLVTLNVFGGGYSPSSSLQPGSEFGSSGSVGAAATLWIHRNFGLRANVLYARTDASAGAPDPLTGEKPDIWTYSGDLLARLPIAIGNGRDFVIPYLVGGLGGKTYNFDELDTATDFAGNLGAGLEYRFARWGVQAEVRDVISSFDRFGVEKTQHDIVWTGGITLSF
jgi:hypothetical protein